MNKPMLTVLVFWLIIALVVTLLVLWPKVVAIAFLIVCAALLILLISIGVYSLAKDAFND